MPSVLSEKVVAFVRDHIDSVSLLDILCVLARDPIRDWSAAQIASELRSNPKAIRGSLARLAQSRVIFAGAEPETWVLRDEGAVTVSLITEVCASFRTYNSRMIELIYSDRKNQKLRSFADAFRISGRKTDRGES